MAPIVRDYTVILTPELEVGGFSVAVPALPEIATQGETRDEALAMARDAIELSLAYRRDEGLVIPDDVTPIEQRLHIEIAVAWHVPGLPVVTSRQVVRVLERAGFALARQSASSHAIYRHPGGCMVIAPMHVGDLKPGTLRSILASAGLTVEELRRLL